MAQITAQMVNELRQKTGVGMKECKKALVACDGDVAASLEYLRKSGIAKAAKKAGRSANQGKFVVASKDNVTVLVEILCETDFVAKTSDFIEFAEATADKALQQFSVDGDISCQLAELVSEDLKALIGKLGENMHVRRALRWISDGRIGTYLHTGVPYGTMVEVSGPCSDELLNSICLHVCASNPTYISSSDVPEEFIAKEKEIAAAQPELKGKPAAMLEGILKGKMNRIFKEICLLSQPWIDDEKTTLAAVAPEVKVKRFVRWLVGEEISGECASCEE